jgi:ketosteroid isomerase-like protein
MLSSMRSEARDDVAICDIRDRIIYGGKSGMSKQGKQSIIRILSALTGLSICFGCYAAQPEAAGEEKAAAPAARQATPGKRKVARACVDEQRANSAKEAEAAAPAATPDAAPASATETTAAGSTSEAVSKQVNAWSEAWAERDVPAYLAFYSPNFKGKEKSRARWEASREKTLDMATSIELSISKLRIRMQGTERAVATFTQDYRALNRRDHGQKTLQFRRIDDQWLIEKESFKAGRR